jgi:hypothetical protein
MEWVMIIFTVFNLFFGVYRGPQAEVRNYQTQYPQTVGNVYGSQGVPVYYYGQPPQAYTHTQGY